ncbi:MAG: succinate dehydrogenase, hydrophobic membrane anchor protein [Proteobacteria bacterium]|nr:succinate dehydrogenase, hydrophobic membrane anchor protein [Pseudomonadota bacterium]
MNYSEQEAKKESGVPHWKWQRRSALVLVPLSLWLLYSLVHHVGAPYQQAYEWVANPVVAVLLIVFVGAMFYHAKLGLQVIIEDYIADLSGRHAILKISNLLCWIAMLVGIVSILKIVLNV